MKLYATVASERASKGQGGNEFLDIDIQSGDERGHKLRITLERSEMGTLDSRVSFVSADSLATLYNLQAMTREAIREAKGERQKGELCGECYKRQANEGDTLCEPCAKQNAQ